MTGGVRGRRESREKRSQSWREWLGPAPQDSVREPGRSSGQRNGTGASLRKGLRRRKNRSDSSQAMSVKMQRAFALSGFPPIYLSSNSWL